VAPRLDDEGVVAACERLVPLLAAEASVAERERRLTPSVIEAVGAADLWPMVVPTSLGGHGLGIAPLAHGTRVLAHGCPASAWTISFLVMHSWLLARMPPAGRAELFAPDHPYALAPAPLAPTGTATPVEGGFVVSGRWEWATGVRHADWVLVHAVQTEPELATWFAVLPIGQVEVEDMWHTSGMRATGSEAVRVDGVSVPARRVIPSAALLFTGEPLPGDGMAGLPVPPLLALMAAAPAVGAAEAAVELFRRRLLDRVLAYSLGDRARDQPVMQARLGAATAELSALRAGWDAAVDRLARAGTGPPLTLDERMDLRLAAALAVRAARRIVSDIADSSGASVYFEGSPFQRLQRDLEVLKGHVIFDWDRTTELAGRLALGGEPRPTDMV
jgi:alkylation response protein AidB-like acyl-CoA dehydrogenase